LGSGSFATSFATSFVGVAAAGTHVPRCPSLQCVRWQCGEQYETALHREHRSIFPPARAIVSSRATHDGFAHFRTRSAVAFTFGFLATPLRVVPYEAMSGWSS
jgi:hypothetical protein